LGWDLVESSDTRAPPAPATLVDALDLVGEDLRRYGTCAPAAMAGFATRANDDGRWIDERERAAQVTRT
jgi:hypothetical protein